MPRRRLLVVMVKEPRPGRVKTRLAADIGHIAAARWSRQQTLDLIARLEDPRWSLRLAVSPDHAGLCSRVWPAHIRLMPQGAGDLGARMARLLKTAPPGPTLIVGSDIPDLGVKEVARAFSLLGYAPAVLGPSEDGGYWGVGLRRTAKVPPDLFRDVRWSTPDAFADTLPTLPQPVAKADLLRDVDTLSDLRSSVCRKYPRRRQSGRPKK